MKILISEFSRFFWNFLEFNSIFKEFLEDISLFKIAKKGFLYLHRTRGADVARGTRVDVTTPRGPTRGGGIDTWQDHANPRGRSGGATWQCEGASS